MNYYYFFIFHFFDLGLTNRFRKIRLIGVRLLLFFSWHVAEIVAAVMMSSTGFIGSQINSLCQQDRRRISIYNSWNLNKLLFGGVCCIWKTSLYSESSLFFPEQCFKSLWRDEQPCALSRKENINLSATGDTQIDFIYLCYNS